MRTTKVPVVDQVLELVLSSERSMPAHYTSSNDRQKSFLINFDMNWEDEYNMASLAFYKAHEAITKCKTPPTELEVSAIIKLGEDTVIGSYILKKLDGTIHLPKLLEVLVKENTDIVKIRQSILDDKSIQDYLTECRNYALSKASTLQQPEVS